MKRPLPITSERRWFFVLATLALVYACLANLRTIADPDLFWQLATGRWIAQHHRIFSTDVFSYTSQGQPWIYPAGSGLFLYATYLIGGYVLLSWIGGATCVGTIILLLRRGSAATAAVAILAVPVIAWRTGPRAEMFTVLLFAIYLSVLWEHYQTSRARLWLLPLLMVAWVNLHPGFAAGLVLMAAFVAIDSLEMWGSVEARVAAVARLRSSLPFYLATAVATLANPWGWRIYSELVRQNRAMALHSVWIAEWGAVPMNRVALGAIFSPRSAQSTFYLLLLVAAIAALIGFWQRKPGPALLVIGAVYVGVQHSRMYALTACVVVVIGGALLSEAAPQMFSPQLLRFAAVSFAVLLALLVFVRASDIMRNRRNVAWTFGTGFGWQFPERAAAFIEREKLPGEVFNTYNEGGYVVWRLGPERRDYVDGRALPFGPNIFRHEGELVHSSLDSEVWQGEAERYNINTILLPLNRFEGTLSSLKSFCNSRDWRPVYLDEVSAVFVRRRPETDDLIKRLQIDCSTAPLPAGTPAASVGAAFNRSANAGSVLAALRRDSEALTATEKAHALIPDNSFPFFLRGAVYFNMDLLPEAEQEYRKAIRIEPYETLLWSSLASLYKDEGKIQETIDAQRRAIQLSSAPRPAELLMLAQLYLENDQPRAALKTFDQAMRDAPPDVLAASGDRSFRYEVAVGRAAAWRALGDRKRASWFEQESVRALVPDGSEPGN